MQRLLQNTNTKASSFQINSHSKRYEEVTVDGQKKYMCSFPDCQKTFKFESEMKRHLAIHSCDRPYTCTFPDCGKTFKRADALSNHFRIHSGKTPYDCPIHGCNSQFNTKSALRYHLLKHKGEKSFKCSYPGCEKTFLTQAQLKQHEKASYYHQKIEASCSGKNPSLMSGMSSYGSDEFASTIESRETPLYEHNEEYTAEPQFEAFPYKYEELMKHNENETACSIHTNTIDYLNCLYGNTEYKNEEITTPGTPDMSINVQYPGPTMEDTLKGMISFMSEESEQLKKKFKTSTELYYSNAIETAQLKSQIDVDAFFKNSTDFDTEEIKLGNAFLSKPGY